MNFITTKLTRPSPARLRRLAPECADEALEEAGALLAQGGQASAGCDEDAGTTLRAKAARK